MPTAENEEERARMDTKRPFGSNPRREGGSLELWGVELERNGKPERYLGW